MSAKSLTHIVLFKLKESVDMEEAAKLIDVVKREVPGLVSFEFGPRVPQPYDGYVDRAQGHTHVLVSHHVDAEALHAYADHPAHVALATFFRANAETPAIGIDFFSQV